MIYIGDDGLLYIIWYLNIPKYNKPSIRHWVNTPSKSFAATPKAGCQAGPFGLQWMRWVFYWEF